MEYEVRSEGLTDFQVRFRAVKELREDIVDAMERASKEAGAYMAAHAPYHSGALFRAINVGPVEFRPGGAGGGGFYEVHVGVDGSQAPHAEWVIEGTGIFNREHPTNGIFPSQGNVLTFSKEGEGQIFAAWTRGQEPQREWFETAQEVAQSVIARAIAGI